MNSPPDGAKASWGNLTRFGVWRISIRAGLIKDRTTGTSGTDTRAASCRSSNEDSAKDREQSAVGCASWFDTRFSVVGQQAFAECVGLVNSLRRRSTTSPGSSLRMHVGTRRQMSSYSLIGH